jgi:hypothetical protein
MPYIMVIVAAVLASIAAFLGQRTAEVAWPFRFHFGWAAVALYLWSLVLARVG